MPRGPLLSHQDSNLGKQNQNLMCYHYTMGQAVNEGAKVLTFYHTTKFILLRAQYQHHNRQ